MTSNFDDDAASRPDDVAPESVAGSEAGAEAEAAAAAALKKPGVMSVITSEEFNVMEALGGWRGLAESVIPTVVFLITFVIYDTLEKPLIISASVAVALTLLRLIQRKDVMPALGGLLAMAISAIWAWRTGEASNYFVWGLITNGAYLAVILGSLAARWPVIGVAISFLRGENFGWRKEPERAKTRTRYTQITWMWAGLFAARLAVQLPLYLVKNTEVLGVARLAMGPFLFAIIAWFSWMLVRGLPPVEESQKSSM